MKRKQNRYWIWGLVLVAALQMMVLPPVDAFVISLGEGLPQDPGVMRSNGAEVLYATDQDGQEVKLAGTDAPLATGPHWILADPPWLRMERYYSVPRFDVATRFAGKRSLPTRTLTHFLGCRYLPHLARAQFSWLLTPRLWPKPMDRWCSPRRRTPTEKRCTN